MSSLFRSWNAAKYKKWCVWIFTIFLMIAQGGLLIAVKVLRLDQTGAFLQGAASAIIEDWASPVTNIVSAAAGQEFANSLTPFMGNQAAMSIGRIVGQAVSIVSSGIGAVTGIGIMGVGGGGGLALAPVSGGSTVAVSVASVAGGAAVTAYSGSVAVNAINNMFNDPNIQFSRSDKDGWNDANREPIGSQKGNATRNNQAQNKQVRDIERQLGLSKDAVRELHDVITGQGYSYQEILDIARDMFGK